MSSATKPIAKAPVVRKRQIALPTEHGGWGFLFEPLVAGIAIAFSPAALWIALMTIGAFLVRQPLKVFVVDRLGMRIRDRAVAALFFACAYSILSFAGLAGTLSLVSPAVLLPFVAVLPLAILQIYWDVSRKSRHLLPELSGAISMSASIAVIALAGGMSRPVAFALWAIFAARFIPSIMYVRERLLREKGKQHSRSIPAIAHIVALLISVILAYNTLVPYLTAVAMLILLVRATAGLSPRGGRMKAMQIGVREVIYGAVLAVAIILGYYAGV